MRLIAFIILTITFSFHTSAQKYLLKEDVNKDTIVPKVGFKRKFDLAIYMGYGYALGPNINKAPSKISYGNSFNMRDGIWGRMKITKRYAVGIYLEYSRDEYRLKTPIFGDSLPNSTTKWTKQVNNNMALGLFNRFNLRGEGLFMDIGAYCAYDVLPRILTKVKPANSNYSYKKTAYNKPNIMNRGNYGLDCRFTLGSLSLYGRYRLTGLYKNQDYDLPKMIVGLVVDFKD